MKYKLEIVRGCDSMLIGKIEHESYEDFKNHIDYITNLLNSKYVLYITDITFIRCAGDAEYNTKTINNYK